MTNRLVVTCEFATNQYKQYDFLCAEELALKAGDKVVVDTQHGDQIAKVVGIKGKVNEENKFVGLAAVAGASSVKATRWVIDKINYSAHEARLAKAKKIKELKGKMDARIKKLQAEQVYRMFAENDDELRELLGEYEVLKEC